MSAVDAVRADPAAGTGADAFLDMPLTGVRLIEASAGTGKTFTLATLVTRLVVERGLRVGQVLAVTFTEAATQELRERLRRRLVLLARVATGQPLPADADAGEVALCRTLVERRLELEDAAALRARLQQAARELDLAAVHTIHGFCTRVLADHALESGEPFHAASLLGNDRELREAVAADLWRTFAHDPAQADLLLHEWPSPEALAQDLPDLLSVARIEPAPVPAGETPLATLQQAAATLRGAWLEHGVEARQCIEAALAAGVLSKARVKSATLDTLCTALDAWTQAARGHEPPHGRLDLLTTATLRDCLNKNRDGSTLASPLFDATAAFLEAHARHDAWLDARRVELVHRVRDRARLRLAELKRQRRVRTFDDLIDGVARALDGPGGRALLRQLRLQYRAALVDEFQDTDPRQWSIFRRVFGEDEALGVLHDEALDDGPLAAPRFLALIGDPKQAIYRFRGGDVHTYLRARECAQAAPPLLRNFRSRPCLLRAVERLYAALGEDAFVDARIRFQPVEAGGRRDDHACLLRGAPAPALTVRRLPADGSGKDWDAETSRDRVVAACVDAVHETLALAARGELGVDGRAVAPGDLAVLVRTHAEGLRVQRALALRGIPAVAAGRTSLFETVQALELLAVFEALLAPADAPRLHAALATTLIGLDAAAIDALHRDDVARARQLARALAWRERWLRHGPLALVNELCAAQAPRLLELVDGERRLSDFMQIGEALQEAAQRVLGPQALVDWLRARIAAADDRDPEQQLRLESDARRVQILTLHKSKGLEFPFVFLPFAGMGDDRRALGRCVLPGDAGRVMYLQPDEDRKADRAREEDADDARLLYVALTRAEHALWVATGPLRGHKGARLTRMLADVAAWGGGEVVVDDRTPEALVLPPLPAIEGAEVPRARTARRGLSRDWSIYSFSALARQAAGPVESLLPRPEREDAPAESDARVADADDARFVGARFGDVVHAAFETVDFAAWCDWREGEPPPGQLEPLVEAFRGEGYAQVDVEAGLPLLTGLVGRSLNAALPDGPRLCDLPPAQRRAEMEFHFTLDAVPVDALLATAQAHGLLAERQGFGTRRVLDGLMTGKIDLVYAHDGRYAVLDYKTNRLPDYAPATLARAMHESEYTLQAAIYTLALHRWLRFRLGAGYDYDRHVAGVRYLFCRGVEPQRMPAHGLHAERLPRALIESLDVLFAGGRP